MGVVLLDLDGVPHVDEAGAGRGARDGADPAPRPRLSHRALLGAPLHPQAQVGGQPVRTNPVLHQE